MNSIHSTGAGKGQSVRLLSAGDDSGLRVLRFADLKARDIVSDRADLFRKQQKGFPKAVKFAKGQGAVALFQKKAVMAWIRANMISAEEFAG